MAPRIYTRTGDDGTTGVFGGNRIPKSHARMEALGAVDETNAAIGVVRTCLPDTHSDLHELLLRLQDDLFVVGADLATPLQSRTKTQRITADHVTALESAIDASENSLEPLTKFVLPGGAPAAAALHVARGNCRRAERRVVAALDSIALSLHLLRYLNRLSDLLFVLARKINQDAGHADTLWTGNG